MLAGLLIPAYSPAHAQASRSAQVGVVSPKGSNFEAALVANSQPLTAYLARPLESSGMAAGAAAGASKSTAREALLSGATSLSLPGLGFVWLLFLHTGEVQPNFAEQAELKNKSPAYIKDWTEGYDQALTAKQKHTIIMSSAVGSIVGILLYRAAFSAGS